MCFFGQHVFSFIKRRALTRITVSLSLLVGTANLILGAIKEDSCLDSFRWLPGEEENFKFLNAYIAVSKKDRLCSGHYVIGQARWYSSGHTCALIRGASRPRVGCLDEADWLFLQRRQGLPGHFQACSALVLGLPVHPSSLFQCPLPLSLAGLLLVLLRMSAKLTPTAS